jgi:hypothetical protein
VAGFVEAHHALRCALHLVFLKNEAIIGRLPGNPFVFMVFQDCGGVFEIAEFALASVVLNGAELAERLFELGCSLERTVRLRGAGCD